MTSYLRIPISRSIPAICNVVYTDPERPYTVTWCVSGVVRPANSGVITEIVDLVDQ